MDLFCPHCTRRVTISDDKAGQVTNCPLCAKQFMAPSLAPPPIAPKPPPPPVSATPKTDEGYGVGPAPVPPPSPSLPAAPNPTPSVSAPPPPPPPPGEYTRSFVCHLSDTWLPFVTPACVVLIFVLSFMTWHSTDRTTAASLWGLAFSQMAGHMIAYAILMIPAFPLVFAVMVFDKGWIATPPQLAMPMTFKNLVIFLLLGLTFLMLCYDYLDGNLFETPNPIALPMKLAFRLHFVAMIASLLMFWLNWRKRSNLPLPRIEMRW